jgi:ADP-heptose:LPS heptosyltransferase
MNVANMRRIDRWVGVPICFLLTLVRKLGDLVLRRRPPAKPRRIAVIKLAEQGATVLAYPALVRAAEMVGRENLFFVVFSQNRFILDLLGVVPAENVLAIEATGPVRTMLETLRVVWRMRRERIDAALDFEFFARSSAILAYLSGATSRVGFHAYAGEASYRGDLMTHRLSFNPFLHASEIFRLEVEALQFPPNRLPGCDYVAAFEMELPRYEPAAEMVEEVKAMLRSALDVEVLPSLVLLNANCSDLLPLRRWEPDRYVELTQRLLSRDPDLAIVFTGAPDEAAKAEDLVARIGSRSCVSLAGRTTLEQLIVLYCLAELMVTNDSGPAHYATITPIDVITIFGPETPAVFGARTPQSHLLWAGVACSPCVNAFNDRQSSCRDNVCMQRISVDEVFETSCRVLDARMRGRGQGEASADPRPSSASAPRSSGR